MGQIIFGDLKQMSIQICLQIKIHVQWQDWALKHTLAVFAGSSALVL